MSETKTTTTYHTTDERQEGFIVSDLQAELDHREKQLDLALAALLSIYQSPRRAKETARKALSETLGFKDDRHVG